MTIRALLSLAFLGVSLSACAAGSDHGDADVAPDFGVPPRDGGPDAATDAAMDSGSDSGTDAAVDAGTDAAADSGTDASTDSGTDAPTDSGTDAPAMDGGTPSITVDGTVTDAEWAGAVMAASTTVTTWAGNELRGLRAWTDGIDLYIAVEGVIETMNAMVVYVDAALGSGGGICDLATLTDGVGDLDDALSAGFTTPGTFCADRAWGTRDMSRTLTGLDTRMGWRDITMVGDFAWISASEGPTACGASACEASLPLTSLGAHSGDTIALFARITNGTGLMSPNQTLPMDDPADPRTVTALLEVPVP